MPKLTIEGLRKLREEAQADTSLREGGYRAKITVHMGTCGIASGARRLMGVLMEEIAQRNIRDVILTTSGCAGLCSREPMATVELLERTPVKYCDLDEDKMREIFINHVLGGKVVEQYALALGSETAY